MRREANIIDLDDQGLRRHHNYNPLFDVLTDEFDNAFKEKKVTDDFVLDHYYVDEREDVSVTNEAILEKFPHGVENVVSSKSLTSAIDFSNDAGFIYFLIGKKGIGKTTLLKYYDKRVLSSVKNDNRSRTLSIYLNLRHRKSDNQFLSQLPKSLVDEIYDYIDIKIPEISIYLSDPNKIRELNIRFEHLSNNELIKIFIYDKEKAIIYLFEWLKSQGYEIIIIVDNIDDFGSSHVVSIIDKCQYMKDKYHAKCIIAVRDSCNPKKLGIDEDKKFSILNLSEPNIEKIIKKRLNSIDTSSISTKIEFVYGGKQIELTSDDIIDTFNHVVNDLMNTSPDIRNQLYQLANYDVREFLANIYYFFHSPYLYSRPNFIRALLIQIKTYDRNVYIRPYRQTRFFDYIENFMTAHALCYDIDSSKIFNLFYHDWDYGGSYNYKNTLIFIRILQLAPEKYYKAISKATLIKELQSVGYDDGKAIENAISILLKESLLESPDGRNIKDVEIMSISKKGEVYLKILIKEYSYLVLVCDAVPMPQKYRVNIYQKFGDEAIPLSRGDLSIKNDSVRKFVGFLELEEENEHEIARSKDSVLTRIKGSSNLIDEIDKSVELSIKKMGKNATARAIQKITAVRKV